MTCLSSVPWPLRLQPFCPLAAAAAPEPARATLPAVTATSASAIASAPAIFRRLLILSSSSMTGKTYALWLDYALWLENGSRREVEKVTGGEQYWLLGPNEAHSLVHLLERRRRRLAGFGRASSKDCAELRLVGPQLLVAHSNRIEQRYERLGDVGLELPIAAAVVAGFELGDRLAGRDRHDLQKVRDAGLLPRLVADVAAGVGDPGLDLLPDGLRRVGDQHRALWLAVGGRHLPPGLLQVHDP